MVNKDIAAGKNNTIEYLFYQGKILTPDMQAAQAFEKETPQVALAKHPQLAGAHTALALVEKQAQADGLDAKQRAIIINAARARIAKNIENSTPPDLNIREEIEFKREQTNER